MKRTASILLLGILLFNLFGYRIVTVLQEQKAVASLQIRLDNNSYDQDDLITIKIPSAMPYSIPSANFERVDGEIEIDGVHYNYVKRRLYNDSLEFVCIPNQARMKVAEAGREFYRMVNDLDATGETKSPAKNTLAIKNLLSEFFEAPSTWSFGAYTCLASAHAYFFPASLAESTLSPQERPPDAC